WHARLDIELGGGGRYDDLVMTLGGSHETPAVGFAYGLERLRLVLEENAESNPIPPIEAMLIPVTADEYGYAIRVAEQLRAEGLNVEVNVRERSVKAHFKYANKRNIAFAVVIGSTEQQAQQVTLKDLVSQDERQLSIGDAVQVIKQKAKTVNHA
ncbi:MAG: ATP phosphoribosyltransferase regulatory subunit, partial [Okeania sp. SIO3B3]|nr:ATP phosphoribosyltransferase regulatory subunit [Okeania sp. SIO3B3]